MIEATRSAIRASVKRLGAAVGRREPVPGDIGAGAGEPRRQPGALEPGVAGDEDAPAGVPGGVGRHRCGSHGGSPLCHSSSSCRFSRRVSIGWKKPSCR